jgi:DNA-directed RNA polymerase specialized sigma24 family protein
MAKPEKTSHKTFEENYPIINAELEKRRYKWRLHAIAWLDYDDVKQIILCHFHKQWEKWDQKKDFLPWVNRVITNQTINLIRNLYGNVARPCVSLNCAANEGGDSCRIYDKQCSRCPLYAYWEKHRKVAHDVKLPVSIENNEQQIYSMPGCDEDLESKANYVHERMKEILTPIQYKVYKYLIIDGKSEEETAILMGYKTSERHRQSGYKQIHNMHRIFVEKAKKIVFKELL